MKRREFLSSAGAAAVIPVLPLPAMATPVATAPVRATQVGWAALFARVNDRATPALLQKWMGVGPEQANALMSELVKRNIIHAPVAGTAASVQPMYQSGGIPGVAKRTGQMLRKVHDVIDAFDAPNQDMTDAAQVDQHSPDPTAEHQA
ncbi:hypothetical protein N9741_00045 [Octadecabacter sp.]|nr:hypothetical protein [Octadecabacter sp.]